MIQHNKNTTGIFKSFSYYDFIPKPSQNKNIIQINENTQVLSHIRKSDFDIFYEDGKRKSSGLYSSSYNIKIKDIVKKPFMLDYKISTEIKLKTNHIRNLKLLACSQELLNKYKQINIKNEISFIWKMGQLDEINTQIPDVDLLDITLLLEETGTLNGHQVKYSNKFLNTLSEKRLYRFDAPFLKSDSPEIVEYGSGFVPLSKNVIGDYILPNNLPLSVGTNGQELVDSILSVNL